MQIKDITPETLVDASCRACVYWEHPDRFSRKFTEEEAGLKAKWFEETATEFDPCGKLLYLHGEAVAYCQYAPARLISGASHYPKLSSHLGEDAVLITCLHVADDHQREGLGKRLLREVIDDLKNRGVRSVYTVARDDSSNNPAGPSEFYLGQGFSVVATETFPNGASLSLVKLEL